MNDAIACLQVGDNHLLDRCFKEGRFNSYIVGEIHTCDKNLIPNSRRDDFVDNSAKTTLYNLIEKELGLPLSKEIREKSKINVSCSKSESNNEMVETQKFVSNHKKQSDLINSETTKKGKQNDILEKILDKCGDCKKLQTILTKLDN